MRNLNGTNINLMSDPQFLIDLVSIIAHSKYFGLLPIQQYARFIRILGEIIHLFIFFKGVFNFLNILFRKNRLKHC